MQVSDSIPLGKKITLFGGLWLLGAIFFLVLAPEIRAAQDRNDPPSPPKTEIPENPSEKVVLDFENLAADSLINRLGGASGSWVLDPSDVNNSYCIEDVIEEPKAKEGTTNHVLRLNYSVDSDRPSQGGFWTNLMDFDARPYDHLAMDVRGDPIKGFPERFMIEVKKCKAGVCTGDEKKDDVIKGTARIPVTRDWKTVMIPLNQITGIIDFMNPEAWKDPTAARQGLNQIVIVLRDREVTKKTGVIYLDNIRFVKTGQPGPTAMDKPARHVKKTPVWMEGLEYAQFLVKRLKGFPQTVVVQKDFPKDDREFLRMIAKDTWRFFDEMVDQEHALPLDTIQLATEGNVAMEEGAMIGDYTNVTNIGIYLMSLVAAYDLKFITKEDAVDRIRKTLNTVENLEYHKPSGFLYNYYDTTTLERTDYFVSLVDSGWLMAGLYVIKNAFPEVELRAQALIDRGKLGFFYDPVERQMFHGYYDHLGVFSDYHYGIYYAEHRATSYMAIARKEVPEDHWFGGLIRTFPESAKWQQLLPQDRNEESVHGLSFQSGNYLWKDIRFVPSWGGSAFEALMPTLVLDEKNLSPEALALNNKRHVEGQIRYAKEELGYPVWGMSPCSDPDAKYSEFGVAPFGSKGYKAGVVTPHASVLALEEDDRAVIQNLRKLLELYEIYGEYGFFDAVTVKTGHVARKYLSLNQGMILLSIDNYLENGAIRKRFHKDPVLAQGESLLRDEKLFFGEPKPVPVRSGSLQDEPGSR